MTACPADSNGAACGPASAALPPTDLFIHRHIGPDEADVAAMLETVGCASLDQLIDQTVPASIRLDRELNLGPARGEHELIEELRALAGRNKVYRSCIGLGYHHTITPPVIQRNILENPGWYTQYTPYQAEISQGRLEALLNFQTMIADLTGLPVAGASLLDEGTAAAEAMSMCHSVGGPKRGRFFVAADCHPQTIGVVRTRADSLGIELKVGKLDAIDWAGDEGKGFCGALVQYPTTDGRIIDYRSFVEQVHGAGALAVVAADLLALALITPPGEFGADIAVGSAQRFGVPMGFGGPHAAYMATHEKHVRKMPGRIIGVSVDANGDPAYRMAIQTREQHIKRERATSNICTAQALLAIMAGMYAVYHGPTGLRRIARRVHRLTAALAEGLRRQGHELIGGNAGSQPVFFDTLRIRLQSGSAADALRAAERKQINLRLFTDGTVGLSLDELSDEDLVRDLLDVFGGDGAGAAASDLIRSTDPAYAAPIARASGYLTHPVFNTHHSETEMLRYIFKLQGRDLSLAHSMIPLGSCTMKLNATSEMLPVTWPEFSRLHPFAPADQTEGYRTLFRKLEAALAEITGLPAVSLQPNAGSQGEYAGLMVIRAYHASGNEGNRNVCLIPTSAHGTNPASAVIAGFRVVAVKCDEKGNIDVADLKARAAEHAANLGALMITYPSTHGVFEESVREICEIIHAHGGQVYMDGANMNAQVGLCSPGDIGADVCHLNLHKTFCIPHGGGGPGMGPIAAADHLAPFLPGHPVGRPGSAGEHAIGPISAAPYGSPSILTISWVYIALMGAEGLKRATQVAILNANYMAARLAEHFPILYRGKGGRVAHEFIVDCRAFEESAGVRIDDIAKRLMDYGFHAPTMSWPVPGTLMIEPTESESKAELDRFCEALISIRQEIREIEASGTGVPPVETRGTGVPPVNGPGNKGAGTREDNLLKGAPHTAAAVTADDWSHPYSRRRAAYPAAWLTDHKFWPPAARIDNAYGDRHLICTCPSVEELAP